MSISPFFRALRPAYQAEIDDLTFDSEGRDVLKQRLAQRRKELGFLIQMIELSPEMVSVVFHQAFRFHNAAAMEDLISHESEELPDWDSFSNLVTLAPWAKELAALVLQQPKGAWLLSVAAGLEYMYGKADGDHTASDDNDDESSDNDGEDFDGDDEREAQARDEAGADWMAEQGFDRKD
ncbi:hypothetical protein [Rhodoferax aquaticus]|uniref:Uncharacterized protein n=1 Tax=Rhodoferax aquaticus TaxID=2527691 RepID=A0A515EPI5_9BURK|nr:hypothetical protein [Rhodoferax aquaticus]QDL54540.1 hypothetical protein EXZ61_10390 [Rhodoferax aquaticus]